MAKKTKVRKRRANSRRSKWIMAGLFILGLIIGAAAGFYLHYYVLNPSKKSEAESKETASKSGGSPVSKQEKKYKKPLPADPAWIRGIMSYLSDQIGVRVEGTSAELTAATYLKGELEKLGYSVGWQEFTLPNGSKSVNLVTADPGTTNKYTFLVSGHIDSRSGSPGANDNASGCAAVLEMARTTRGTRHLTEIRYLLFGSEEDFGPRRTPSRIGSTYYLGTQLPAERAKMVGMVSADMIAVGPEVHFRDWGPNSPGLAQGLAAAAQSRGLNAFQDPNEQSDHEPFGLAGIPAVWMERTLPGGEPDPALHTSSDNMAQASPGLVSELVDLLRGYVLGLDDTYCNAAVAR